MVTTITQAPIIEVETFTEKVLDSKTSLSPTSQLEEATRSYLMKQMRTTAPQKIRKLAKLIVKHSKQHGMPVGLVLSLIRVESGFQAWAVSSKGAIGLMQIMPDTGEWLAGRMGMKWEGPVMLLDEETNVRMGLEYLSYLKRKYQGDLKMVLSAYNRGPGKVDEDVESGRDWNLSYHDKVKNYFPKIAYGGRL